MNGGGAVVEAPLPETGVEAARARGIATLRVLLLGFAAALLIGSAGYVASVAMEQDPPIPSTMCVDSSCTFAMSAGAMPMNASSSAMPQSGMQMDGSGQPMTAHKQRSAPERFVRGLLSICHLR